MGLDQTAQHALADYLHRRLKYLESCNAHIENKLADDQADLCLKIDEGEYSKDDAAVGQMIFDLEYVVANTVRYTMLVGVCSFLEEALKAITKRLVPDYSAKLEAEKRGNWLRKHIRILSTSVGLDAEPLNANLDKFHDLIILRNCIVHAWGKVTEARDPNAVETAAKRIETAEISKDRYLVLGDQVIPAAINTAERIAEAVLTRKLGVSMT